MQYLEQRLQKIEERNRKVESDKAWETSWTRRGLLMLFTYLAIGIYLQVIDIERPWLNALVPTVGFMLSTLTMPFFKHLWLSGRDGLAMSNDLIAEKEREKATNLGKLREFIKGKEQIANDDVEDFLGVSNATSERYLEALEREGLLRQIGRRGRGVHYEVVKK